MLAYGVKGAHAGERRLQLQASSLSNDLVQSFHNVIQDFRRQPREFPVQPFNGKSSDLTDLDP
jgi:hypothetical protein